MGCCGKKRESLKSSPVGMRERMPVQPVPVEEVPKPAIREILFYNMGPADMNVRGPISGRTYHFPGKRVAIAVDVRDAAYLSGISRLREGVQPVMRKGGDPRLSSR